jgi:hypothetical protein
LEQSLPAEQLQPHKPRTEPVYPKTLTPLWSPLRKGRRRMVPSLRRRGYRGGLTPLRLRGVSSRAANFRPGQTAHGFPLGPPNRGSSGGSGL